MGLPGNGSWNFVDIPGQYATNKRDRKERKIPISHLFLRSPWRVLHIAFTCILYRASEQTLLYDLKYILRLTKSYPVDRGFVIEPKNIITNISSV